MKRTRLYDTKDIIENRAMKQKLTKPTIERYSVYNQRTY